MYEPLSKDTASAVEREVQKLLSKYKNTRPTWLKYKLTPCHSKPPRLQAYLKHTGQMFLERPIRSIVSTCYAPAGFLHKILYPLVGKTEIWVKKSE